ncbi:MAG: LPS export ABC transporter permease LptG [Methylobacteriaceae bacterium]|nr:LPS export ABC transporter permease LptG [Methylobacteriaceae bacterium]
MILGVFGRYVGLRFARTILFVFLGFFALIFLVDFVELLRRSGDVEGANPLLVAGLSLLRVPAVAEQILPFAVLFGAMVSLLNLSRRLELVVARAAGLSAWQFLTPPALAALAFGLFFVGLYNPVSATLKQRADRIETRLFGKTGSTDVDTSMWIRQRSVDGQAIIRAEKSSDAGAVLAGVTVFLFEPNGRFMERVEAARARLAPGVWTLEDARVIAPAEEPRDSAIYYLATNLAPDQVAQSFVPPDTVPFWSLPDIRDRTRQAGLDATGYELRYQTLLARPLFLVAMVMIAASFSLRFFRMGGVARSVLGGVTAGFVLYVGTKLVADLGGAGLISAPVAAWSPALVGALFGTLVVLNQEDG